MGSDLLAILGMWDQNICKNPRLLPYAGSELRNGIFIAGDMQEPSQATLNLNPLYTPLIMFLKSHQRLMMVQPCNNDPLPSIEVPCRWYLKSTFKKMETDVNNSKNNTRRIPAVAFALSFLFEFFLYQPLFFFSSLSTPSVYERLRCFRKSWATAARGTEDLVVLAELHGVLRPISACGFDDVLGRSGPCRLSTAPFVPPRGFGRLLPGPTEHATAAPLSQRKFQGRKWFEQKLYSSLPHHPNP